MFGITALKVLMMIAYGVPGFLLVKLKALGEDSIKAFAKFLLYVCQPALSLYTLSSVQSTPQLIKELWIFFAATVIAMPTATTETMLAELYDIDPGYSAQAVGTTSLFSVITMPLVIFYVQMVLLPL